MMITVVEHTLETWLQRVNECGVIPDAAACEELLLTAPLEAEAIPEYLAISKVAQWREMRMSDEAVLRKVTAFWSKQDARAAA